MNYWKLVKSKGKLTNEKPTDLGPGGHCLHGLSLLYFPECKIKDEILIDNNPNLLVISSVTFLCCNYKERHAYGFRGV